MDDYNSVYASVPQEEDYFGDVEFMLYTYKVERCMISQPHAWKNCPFVHHQEPIKRRHPTQHMAHLCPLVKKGQTCPDDKCCWAHNAFELWLHPERYKTIMCRKGAACGRGICFFAHSEAELRVPSKAKTVDLSKPAAAAGAVGAALKFKAVAQALPKAAISAAPVSGRRSPVSLQVPAVQDQQPLGVPSMSLGVPSMSLGVPSMSLAVPAASIPLSLTIPSMSLGVPAVPEHLGWSSLGQGAVGYNQSPVNLDFGLLNGGLLNGLGGSRSSLQHMAWASSASSATATHLSSADSSSHSSSSTRLDAGDSLLSDLYACAGGDACSSSSTASAGAASFMPVAFGQQQCGCPVVSTGLPAPALGGFSMPQQQQQQPMLLDLAQAAAAVRAEVEKGSAAAAADQEAALQAAADRVAALLFSGRFGGLCAGDSCCPGLQQPRVQDSARKSRSLDLPVVDTAVTAQQQQYQLVRLGSL